MGCRQVSIIALLLLLQPSSGFRRTSTKDSLEQNLVGRVLAGRYLLVKQLENRLFGHGSPIAEGAESTTGVEYQRGKKLGSGNYAVAYLAHVVVDGVQNSSPVVVKLLKHPQDKDDRKQTSAECTFLRELQETKSDDEIGKSRLIKCLADHVEQDNFQPGQRSDERFIVVEYGGEELKKDTHLPRIRAAVAAKQMLQGVRYMASQGLQHRDLKSANCLVSWSSGQPLIKIIDFGLASRDAFCVERHSYGSCTLDFSGFFVAPPEVRRRGWGFMFRYAGDVGVDYYDTWSVGIMAWNMLCANYKSHVGMSPVEARDVCSWAQRNGCFDLCSKAGFDDEVKQLLAGALQADPKNRQSADELLQAMAQVTPSEPASKN